MAFIAYGLINRHIYADCISPSRRTFEELPAWLAADHAADYLVPQQIAQIRLLFQYQNRCISDFCEIIKK
jgi:hypothetical protein